MSLIAIPWAIPSVISDQLRTSALPSSTAMLPPRDPNDTSTTQDLRHGPLVQVEPVPDRPRVGRPRRGDRAQVKAGRRAARRAR